MDKGVQGDCIFSAEKVPNLTTSPRLQILTNMQENSHEKFDTKTSFSAEKLPHKHSLDPSSIFLPLFKFFKFSSSFSLSPLDLTQIIHLQLSLSLDFQNSKPQRLLLKPNQTIP
eukprot:TRINITY_DN10079_c1_g1_i1.p1 TRINITY_DN10079_c1_g1~~TRINITY_DN10079_c1_g1_i1.p1  ORF type:complete len:114 (-),score=13.86 TRINITY_DN10079_c1_g1_i1:924-1265(-)